MVCRQSHFVRFYYIQDMLACIVIAVDSSTRSKIEGC